MSWSRERWQCEVCVPMRHYTRSNSLETIWLMEACPTHHPAPAPALAPVPAPAPTPCTCTNICTCTQPLYPHQHLHLHLQPSFLPHPHGWVNAHSQRLVALLAGTLPVQADGRHVERSLNTNHEPTASKVLLTRQTEHERR